MIEAKVSKVERDRGNLNITVKFYYKGKELEGEDEQYLIPENGLEKERLKASFLKSTILLKLISLRIISLLKPACLSIKGRR